MHSVHYDYLYIVLTVYCRSICDEVYAENIFQFDRPGVGATLIYDFIEGLILVLLVVAIEVRCT